MTLTEISQYWNSWYLKAAGGDNFAFIDIGGGDQAKDDQAKDIDSSDEEDQSKGKAISPPLITIDEGILPPLLCNRNASERTQCLQSLVAGRSKNHKVFRALVNLVNGLEVSSISYDFYHVS
jgi:hypothetical protein